MQPSFCIAKYAPYRYSKSCKKDSHLDPTERPDCKSTLELSLSGIHGLRSRIACKKPWRGCLLQMLSIEVSRLGLGQRIISGADGRLSWLIKTMLLSTHLHWFRTYLPIRYLVTSWGTQSSLRLWNVKLHAHQSDYRMFSPTDISISNLSPVKMCKCAPLVLQQVFKKVIINKKLTFQLRTKSWLHQTWSWFPIAA
jgi:hypothetical protein